MAGAIESQIDEVSDDGGLSYQKESVSFLTSITFVNNMYVSITKREKEQFINLIPYFGGILAAFTIVSGYLEVCFKDDTLQSVLIRKLYFMRT